MSTEKIFNFTKKEFWLNDINEDTPLTKRMILSQKVLVMLKYDLVGLRKAW